MNAARKTLSLPPVPRPPPTDVIAGCIAKLEHAAAIRISHTDSDSRVEQLNAERQQAMRDVIAELKSLA